MFEFPDIFCAFVSATPTKFEMVGSNSFNEKLFCGLTSNPFAAGLAPGPVTNIPLPLVTAPPICQLSNTDLVEPSTDTGAVINLQARRPG